MSQPHILVVANATCPCPDVLEVIRDRAGDDGRVLIVAPSLNSRLRHWLSDSDAATRAAHERLDFAIGWLAAAGVDATGQVGDGEPLVALADALAGFPATELVIATHPEGQSHWLERDLPRRANERFSLPVVHVVSRMGVAVAA